LISIRHHSVPASLLPFIERAVTIDYSHAVGMRWHVVPSGCFGLSVVLGDSRDDYELEHGGFECFFTGVLPRALGTWCDRRCVVLSIALTPLAVAHLPLEAHDFEIASWIQQETLVGSPAIARLRTRLRDAASLDDKVLAFLGWVEGLLLDGRLAYGRRAAIAEAAMQMRFAPGPVVADAALRVGVARRQLERDFRRYLGTSPKRYEQVAKIQQLARLAWRGVGLAGIAAELGYVDQAHMTHAVHEITGMSPSALLQRAQSSEFARATRPFWGGTITNL
jgi:AraC-like DNA-binding protein